MVSTAFKWESRRKTKCTKKVELVRQEVNQKEGVTGNQRGILRRRLIT